MNCLLTGVGGQGIVLASKIISQTAMNLGLRVTTAETIGMAQRGGSVVSHVRIGDDVYSPLIAMGTADLVIAFEPAEAVRVLPYLKKGGTMVVCDKAIQPVTASLSGKGYDVNSILDFLRQQVQNLTVVNVDEVIEKCGNAKVLNVALIGATTATNALGMSLESVIDTMKSIIPERFIQMNMLAFNLTAKGE